MYGKVFASMWGGSLYGRFEASAVLMVLLTLCDREGLVDMTPEAIAGRTGWPLEFIRQGLAELEAPDARSRSPGHDGRRIIPVDPDRSWGWQIANYSYYRFLADAEDKRRKDRERIAEKRASARAQRPVATRSEVSQSVRNVAHAKADAEAYAEAEKNPQTPAARAPRKTSDPAERKRGGGMLPAEETTAKPQAPAGLDPEAWEEWERYRRAMGKAIKEPSREAAQAAMARLGSAEVQRAAVKHSKANGWQGLFAPDGAAVASSRPRARTVEELEAEEASRHGNH